MKSDSLVRQTTEFEWIIDVIWIVINQGGKDSDLTAAAAGKNEYFVENQLVNGEHNNFDQIDTVDVFHFFNKSRLQSARIGVEDVTCLGLVKHSKFHQFQRNGYMGLESFVVLLVEYPSLMNCNALSSHTYFTLLLKK